MTTTGTRHTTGGETAPGRWTVAWLVWVSIIGFSPTPLLAAVVLFPTGRATNPVTQVVLVWTVGAQLVSHALQLGNALGLVGGDWADFREFADTAVAVSVFAVLLMHVATYRRRPRTQQLQLKYLIAVLLFGALTFLVGSGGALTVFDGTPGPVRAFLDVLGLLGLLFVGGVTGFTQLVPTQDRLAVAVWQPRTGTPS